MKLNKISRSLYFFSGLIISAFIAIGCANDGDENPIDDVLDSVGSLIAQSDQFTHFASLISIADQEIPAGEVGIMQMLSDINSTDALTVFAPSDEVFEQIAIEWSSQDFQVTVGDVIGEFTHNGQPAKTRDFVLGHIFKGETSYEASAFQPDLTLESQKGIRWRMVQANANSGFGFVLENSSNNNNPYVIYETDVLIGSNGVVHAALVN